ncbi:MAG: aldehyde dehydrogenase family protein, partial [Acidobacteriia bacterium]|nr:aldehyde dehydrogenase family protein [Terriglobia bacterium]
VSIQEVRAKVEKAYAAFQKLRTYSQEQLDAIVEAMGAAGRANAQHLAELAVQETGYGNVKDKISKNLLNADLLPRMLRGMKTVGLLREIPEQKIVEMGVPVGVVAAILPTTNPTSTAIYKIIIALKAGNTVVVSPHPRAKACTCETARLLYEAAIAAGAPADCIQCIQNATIEGTDALMRHPRTSVILATGGHGIVKAAYSSGKPAFGVGPGNVPVLLDASADLADAVAKVVEGKSFDYGTVCSSEQTLVVLNQQKALAMDQLRKNGAYICSEAQSKALAKLLIAPNWRINANCVGQAPEKIAKMAGFEVPSGTSILVVEIGGVGKEHPLSMEKLSPVLSLLSVSGWEEQVRGCQAILKFGGLGHTCVIHSRDEARTREFGMRMPAFRVLVNTPAPQGSTGITTGVPPAMTLGCGAMAGNSTSDNVGPMHLVNVKRLAYVVRTVEEAFPESGPTAASSSSKAAPSTVGAAVERYLSRRGLRGEPVPATTAGVVDRFLTTRILATQKSAADCGCAVPVRVAQPMPAPAPVPVTDFVCEADVRAALQKGQKIFIGAKTIVTPAAREFAGQHDILVLAER